MDPDLGLDFFLSVEFDRDLDRDLGLDCDLDLDPLAELDRDLDRDLDLDKTEERGNPESLMVVNNSSDFKKNINFHVYLLH